MFRMRYYTSPKRIAHSVMNELQGVTNMVLEMFRSDKKRGIVSFHQKP
jgi:hypothetical protein